MTVETNDYVNWFRHSSPYINAHRGKTFVIVFGGEAAAHPGFSHIIHDIALLNSLGVKLVIVYGARPQIEVRLEERGIEGVFHNGWRVTDLASLEAAKEAVGSLRADIEALLSLGLPNSPMHGAQIRVCSGNFVVAKPLGIHDGVDFQHTGEVRRVDREAIRQLLADGDVVLLPPLGYSPTGEIFNVAAEEIATQVALDLGADKLIGFGEASGVLDGHGELLPELKLSEVRHLLEQGSVGALHPLLQAMISASQGGIERCHLVSYAEEGSLIRELFTRDGCGTLIYQDTYESIRPAQIDDVGGILELIQPLEERGVLARRSREVLETEIDRFTVIDRDGAIIGCAALYPFLRERCGEIACVVTHPDYRGDNRGERLLAYLEREARSLGLLRVFVLTTRTAHWFQEQGFGASSVAELPEKRQSLYNWQRNSKVFAKAL